VKAEGASEGQREREGEREGESVECVMIAPGQREPEVNTTYTQPPIDRTQHSMTSDRLAGRGNGGVGGDRR